MQSNKFAKNMMAQKLMSENKDNPFNSRFFQPSDAFSKQRTRPIQGQMTLGNLASYFMPFSKDIGPYDDSPRLDRPGGVNIDFPPIAKDAYSGIMKFGQAMRGQLSPEEIQKLAFDTSMNVTGGTLLGSKLLPNAMPRNALAMGLSGGKPPKDNVIKLDFQKKKIEAELNKKDAPRDTSSGHAADGVPTQFGPPAHDMNLRISEEFTPEGFGTFSTDVGNNYENLKFFISSSRGTPQFKEEVDFYRKLFAIKGNPDAEITVYRASPTNDLRPGDLVTPIKSDAQFLVDESKITQSDIIKSQRQARKDSETIDLREEKNLRTMEDLMSMLPIKENTPSKLFEYKVKAKDIRWDGNNGLIRWGYFPDKS